MSDSDVLHTIVDEIKRHYNIIGELKYLTWQDQVYASFEDQKFMLMLYDGGSCVFYSHYSYDRSSRVINPILHNLGDADFLDKLIATIDRHLLTPTSSTAKL